MLLTFLRLKSVKWLRMWLGSSCSKLSSKRLPERYDPPAILLLSCSRSPSCLLSLPLKSNKSTRQELSLRYVPAAHLPLLACSLTSLQQQIESAHASGIEQVDAPRAPKRVQRDIQVQESLQRQREEACVHMAALSAAKLIMSQRWIQSRRGTDGV